MRRTLMAPLLLLGGCLFTADQVDPVSLPMRPDSPDHLFSLLVDAYEARSVAALDALLAPDYLFIADAASLTSGSDASWGKDQEKERARKMFAAIGEVRMRIQFDPTGRAEAAPRETTWTAWDIRMEMVYQGDPWVVASSRAEFRLRAETGPDGSTLYKIVRWSDFN
ncbi:MAG: nuclear transport factor 2 family protein [Fibrobacteria bacterium]|nr:nuclear transport factor 2 family protein [Fibrobacteria bacterium]